jgi:hypothetical protein
MYMATAETGVAVVAEVISEGKVLDTGVDSLPSLGLVVEGMLAFTVVDSDNPHCGVCLS